MRLAEIWKSQLTERELFVYSLIEWGMTLREASDALAIFGFSHTTVDRIYKSAKEKVALIHNT